MSIALRPMNNNRRNDRGSGILRAVLVLTMLWIGIFIATPSFAEDRLYYIKIDKMSAASALEELAMQTESTILFPYDVAAIVKANSLYGEFSIKGALENLLQDTGLKGSQTSGGIFVVAASEIDNQTNPEPDMIQNKKTLKGASSILIGSLIATGAQAQETQKGRLDEIIVTAQKKSENLQDVPISISAVGESDLKSFSTAGEDIRVLAARVPNLNIESTFGRVYPRFYLRGQGNVDFRLNATQPVATYYDEVVLDNPALRGMPLFDLERVEVLRGPQGTLWGKNTTGGAVHLISKKPTDETEGYVRLTAGNIGLLNAEGAVGGSINDQLSGRLSVLFQSRNGWVNNTATGNKLDDYEDFAARGQLLWTPTDDFEGLFRVHTRSLDGTATLFNANANTRLDKDQIALESDDNNGQQVDQWGGSAKFSYNAGNYTITSITAYETGDLFSSGDLDGSADPTVSQVNFSDLDEVVQFSQEVRLASNLEGPFNWQAGVYYYRDDMSYTDTGSNLRDFGNHLAVDTNSQSIAVFGHANYDVTDRLNVSGGLRYTDDERELRHKLFYFGPNPADPLDPFNSLFQFDLTFLGAPTAAVERSDGEVTGDFNLNYTVNENVNLYGRIAKGFRAGTIDGNAAFTPVVRSTEPETVLSYEAGIKSDLLDNTLRLNAAVFYYDYQDQQIFSFEAVNGTPGANSSVILQNAKGGTGKGVEVDIEYLPTDNLRFILGYGFIDTDYEGPTFVEHAFTGNQIDIDGNPFPNTPKHTANIVAEYRVPVGDNKELYASTDWSYRSDVNFATYSAPLLTGQGYLEGGLRAGYRLGDLDIAIWGRNLTDVEELTGYTTFTRVGVYTGPRTYGIDLSFSF